METWKFEFDPKEFAAPPPFTDYAMLMPHFTPEQLEASKKVDNRGIGTATIVGWPQETVSEDDEGNPLYFFQLWKAAAINGSVWLSGGQDVPIPEQSIIYRRPQVGGSFARYLQPVALAMEMKNNPNAKSSDAWGWVPPPLLREGEKVQTQWLNDFLLEPYPIRPAVLLRMPKFNMSDQEARDFVNFFAARDNVEYPYEYDRRTQDSYLSSLEAQHPNRLNDALRIVTNSEFCVKCHKIGDFTPAGTAAALAPNLDQVHSRMRSTFLEKWMADPKRLLPFTGMPQNFPQNQPVSQELFHGTSEEQLQAVVDFLLNYNTVMQRQPEVKVAPAASPAGN
jgi:hypothetical protein